MKLDGGTTPVVATTGTVDSTPSTGTPSTGASHSPSSPGISPSGSLGTSPNGPTGADAGSSPADGGAQLEPAPSLSSSSKDAGAPTPAPFDGSCASLPGQIVYIESGDTQESLLKNLGRHLRDKADITLVYNLAGSCTLTSDVYGGVKIAPAGSLKYVPSSSEDAAWAPSMAAPTCTTPAEGVGIDLAISALFVESCALGAPPADSHLKLIQGPVQAYTFVTPTASDQSAIWAEEAYYAFGFGSANPLAPSYNGWNQENFLFIRPATKSTLVATAKNIAVPPNKWKGVQEAASSDVLNAVINSTSPNATLGILGAEVYDNNRNKGLKTLAFQAFKQNGAYFPDSSGNAFDKQNVRDGHYTLWSPTVYITKVDESGVAVNPSVSTILSQVLGGAPQNASAGFDGLADVIKVGLIPECAMHVTRSADGGDLQSFSPENPCTCYYLSHIAGATGAPGSCTACVTNSDCVGSGESCSHGFCESGNFTRPSTGVSGCFSSPATHAELINACTDVQPIVKNVVLPSSTLQPLP